MLLDDFELDEKFALQQVAQCMQCRSRISSSSMSKDGT